LAGVLEYLVGEILEIGGEYAHSSKKLRWAYFLSKRHCPMGTWDFFSNAQKQFSTIFQLVNFQGSRKYSKFVFWPIFRIAPRHVKLAVEGDEELHDLLKDVIIPSAGVYPHIEPILLPRPHTF
jgi:hypothetical protein